MTRLFIALAAGLAVIAVAGMAWAAPLRPVQLGRFAQFVDLASVKRDGEVVTLSYLLVMPADAPGGEEFWGGWSHMAIDCRARTADLTGFTSVRTGGIEGPRTVDTQPGWPIAAGSLDAVLAEVGCDGKRPLERPDAGNVEEAVRLGRLWLGETP